MARCHRLLFAAGRTCWSARQRATCKDDVGQAVSAICCLGFL
ncbi:hypothetical protein V6Z11_D04G152600 [Gossypium hirsutum]|uniref:Uncharacterized protein n=2 Tax=Gossypium TaxID=3633 RepID=A0A5D2LDZ2_GOSTO|nr:hypothetical protein ES288_D04G156000v1 [Gossypium darwinii]TYH77499.1 hypothetical protein ES332_D04G158000v1 [Gossypium tomentosum]